MHGARVQAVGLGSLSSRRLARRGQKKKSPGFCFLGLAHRCCLPGRQMIQACASAHRSGTPRLSLSRHEWAELTSSRLVDA
eukprot:12485428-Alexandrium_andersonii.AAC.1